MLMFLFFVLGLCFGSFANVLIDRIQAGKSIKGRSRCDYCGYRLSRLDNIPVFSFLFLKRKCRKCHKKLSWQYPLIEIGTGLIFILTFWLIQRTQIFQISDFSFFSYFSLFYYILISYILWVILIWDLKYMIIPDFLILIGVCSTIFYKLLESFFLNCYIENFSCPFVSGILGGLILGGFFGFLYWISKGRWIGGGDVKLGFWLGLIVGFQMIYFLLLFSYVAGALLAIFLLLFFGKKMKSEIPFGPFLIGSTYVVIFYHNFILEIWHSFLI